MKLSISRVLETSKYLATDAGKQLQEFITFVADLSENVLRTLRNGITLKDNVDCQVVDVTLEHNKEQILATSKTPLGIVVLRVRSSSTSSSGISDFSWWFNTQNEVVVKAAILGTPSTSVSATLLILYG